MTNPVKIKIVGDKTMGCSGCEGNVEFALSQITGVDEVRADKNTQEVEIYFDAELSIETVTQEMSTLGYTIETA